MKNLHDQYLDYCSKNNIVPATKATIATLGLITKCIQELQNRGIKVPASHETDK